MAVNRRRDSEEGQPAARPVRASMDAQELTVGPKERPPGRVGKDDVCRTRKELKTSFSQLDDGPVVSQRLQSSRRRRRGFGWIKRWRTRQR
jgi:hypothetical protein